MTRPLLSFFCALLIGAGSFSAIAAESASADKSRAEQEVRAQVDKQRDLLSGADQVVNAATNTSSAVLELPVDTDDAPAQVQKP